MRDNLAFYVILGLALALLGYDGYGAVNAHSFVVGGLCALGLVQLAVTTAWWFRPAPAPRY